MTLFFYGSILLVELLAKAHVYSISNHLFGYVGRLFSLLFHFNSRLQIG